MKQALYLTRSGILRRKSNTIVFIPSSDQGQRRYIPVEQVRDIFALGHLEMNSTVVNFLAQHLIPVHFFNYYGTYMATLYPREQDVSGLVVIRQAEHYLDSARRLSLAREITQSAITNMLRVLRYYAGRNPSSEKLSRAVKQLDDLLRALAEATSVDELRGLEGKARDIYFAQWNFILKVPFFHFEQRTRRPPQDPINVLISFGNSLLYATITSEILNVHLHGGISFVHEPGRYRFSLALDLADIFKPVFVDRLIFRMVNHRMIQKEHFDQRFQHILLTDKGKRVFVENWDEMLRRTVRHRTLRRKVSMRHLIRLECYKLIRHFLGEKSYEGFKIWWQ